MIAGTVCHRAEVIRAARRVAMLLAVVLLAAALLFIYTPASEAQGWSAPQNLTPGTTQVHYPQMAVDSQGYTHVVWCGFNGDSGEYNFFYATDAGGSWSEPMLISTTSYDTYYNFIQIAMDPDDNPHVVFAARDYGTTYHNVYYSTKIGLEWTQPVMLSTNNMEGSQPQIAVDASGNAHAVWREWYSNIMQGRTYGRIYYASNAGGAWSAPVLLSTQSSDDQTFPDMALDSSGNAHVVWGGNDYGPNIWHIWYATNAGGTWSAPFSLPIQDGWDQWIPEIGVDSGNNLHLVWKEYFYAGYEGGDKSDIMYSRKAGGTWSAPVRLSTNCIGNADSALISMELDADDKVHVAWNGGDPNFSDWQQVYYTDNVGGAWATPVRLSNEPDYVQWAPDVTVDPDGNAHVVWWGYNKVEFEPLYDYIYYATNESGAWSAPVHLSTFTDWNQFMPYIACDAAGKLHTVWINGYADIRYSENGGSGWSSPRPISNFDEYSGPWIAVDASGVNHAVWIGEDALDGARNIYYSTDAGGKWSFPLCLSITSSDNASITPPQVAVDASGHPHAVWHGKDQSGDDRIYYSTDPGTGWISPQAVSSNDMSLEPQIAVDANGHPHAAWTGLDNAGPTVDIYYSADLGGGWTAPQAVSTSGYNQSPQLKLDSGGNPHMVWKDDYPTSEGIYYSTDPGTGWTSPQLVLSGNHKDPQFVFDGSGRPHVASLFYDTDASSHNVYYSTNLGAGWTTPQAVSSSGYCENPQLAVGPDGIPHVAWVDYGADNNAADHDVYYSTDLGSGWTTPQLISPDSTENGYNSPPQIAADPFGNPRVVWEGYDTGASAYSVYYNACVAGEWSGQEVLADGSYRDGSEYPPRIAVDTYGNPRVIWDGYGYIWYSGDVGYQVDASVSGGGGSVNPAGQWVARGGDASIDIVPDAHCQIAGITDNGVPQAISDPYIISNITEPHDVVVTFAIGVDAAVNGGHGTVEPASQQVPGGSPASIDLVPDTGYHTAFIIDNGRVMPVADPYVIPSVTAYHEVQVIYAIDTFYVNAYVTGGHGSVSPPGQNVEYGGSASIDINPEPGFHVETITDNGVSQAVADPYVIDDVTENHNVVVTFAGDNQPVNAFVAYTGHGSVSPASQIVVYGTDASFDLIPDTGYHPAYITDNGVPVAVADPYIISSVKEAHNVIVYFEPDTCVIAADVDGNGTVEGAGTYLFGDKVELLATPAQGWHFVNWTEGGVEVSTDESWSFSAPGNRDLTAHFAIDTFTVTASAPGGHGLVAPATQEVGWGTDATLNMMPAANYHIATITDNGAAVPVANPYVVSGVVEDHEVVVTFAPDTDTWYLAEGCTAGGMETWILVENPNATPVTLDISFPAAEGLFAPAALQGFVLSGDTRVSFNAGEYFHSYDLSTIVSASGGEIICERAMYGPGRQWATESIGTRTPAPAWYLAEGSTGPGFETWVLVQNPGDAAVTVNLTLMTGAGEFRPAPAQDVLVPAFSRRSFNLGDYTTDYDVSTLVTASGDVVAERAMYGSGRAWGTCSIGAAAPAPIWYLAEGSTGPGFETWVLVQNPGAAAVTVNLTLMTSSGKQAPEALQGVTIPAKTRKTFKLNDYVTEYDVSTLVDASGDVVAERAMYDTGGAWGTCSIGAAAPAPIWYLAEGSAGPGFETWVLVQNPGAAAVTVDLGFMTSSGRQDGPQNVTVPAYSRVSFRLNDYTSDYNVSTEVTSSGGDIVCERAMYGDGRIWATDSIGYAP